MKLLFVILFILISSGVKAAADLELISITAIGGTEFIPPTTSIEVTIKFRNNGPNTLFNSSAGTSFSISPGFRTLGLFRSFRTQPCGYRSEVFEDGNNRLIAAVDIFLDRPLLPNEEITCYANLGVYAEAPVLFNHDFFAVSVDNDDPNLNNNRKTLTIRTRAIPPDVTSVPISAISYASLAVALFGFGACANWRQK